MNYAKPRAEGFDDATGSIAGEPKYANAAHPRSRQIALWKDAAT
jgi:hypothetical protein